MCIYFYMKMSFLFSKACNNKCEHIFFELFIYLLFYMHFSILSRGLMIFLHISAVGKKYIDWLFEYAILISVSHYEWENDCFVHRSNFTLFRLLNLKKRNINLSI